MTDIQATKGDTLIMDVGISRFNSSTNVYDAVTPTKIWFTAKASKRDLDANAIIKLNSDDNPTQVVITTGSVRIILHPGDTANYNQRWLVYDVQTKESDGTITTIQNGNIKLEKDVTIQTV